ncbi:hypothetical protein D9M73_154110 [compost metagenome]
MRTSASPPCCNCLLTAPALLPSAKLRDSSSCSPSAASRRKRKLPSSSRKLTKRALLAAFFFTSVLACTLLRNERRPTASRSCSRNGVAILRALAAPASRMSSRSAGRAISW